MSVCAECEKSWTGARNCHCVACHETFSSESSFSLHQGAIEGCRDPREMVTKAGDPRLVLSERGVWTAPGPAGDVWATVTPENGESDG